MKYSYDDRVEIEQMLGKVFTEIQRGKDADELTFFEEDGSYFLFTHVQDCCESVGIEEIHGDLADLLNTPILFAEESSSNIPQEQTYDSCTWTFYKLGTIKGWVDIRWYGESNGYYSESVDLFYVPAEKKE